MPMASGMIIKNELAQFEKISHKDAKNKIIFRVFVAKITDRHNNIFV